MKQVRYHFTIALLIYYSLLTIMVLIGRQL